MSGSMGPGRQLPGDTLPYEGGDICDECDEPARHAVCGESDSMRSEIIHLCTDHFLHREHAIQENIEDEYYCDRCHHMKTDCRPCRDPEEGISGAVYRMCAGCRDEVNLAFASNDNGDDYLVDDEDPMAAIEDSPDWDDDDAMNDVDDSGIDCQLGD